jgi:hypothetical protein
MTCPLPPMCPHACQADAGCDRPPRFRARLEAASGTQPACKDAEACAGHLGYMVQALAAWARRCDLTDGQLTVLAIDQFFSVTRPGPAGRDRPPIQGFAFGTIRLAE